MHFSLSLSGTASALGTLAAISEPTFDDK